MPRAVQIGAGRYAPSFLAAIDAGLAVRAEDRPQTMAAFRDALDGGPLPAAKPRPGAPPTPRPRRPALDRHRVPWVLWVAGIALLLVSAGIGWWWLH
jgi:hypothetical protein